MLKDTTIALYVLAALAGLAARQVPFAVLLMVFAAITAYFGRRPHESHQFEKQLNRLSAYLLRASLVLALVMLTLVALTSVNLTEATHWTAVLITVLLPGAFIVALGVARYHLGKKLLHDSVVAALQSNLAIGAALGITVLFSLSGLLVKHFPTAINAPQLVLLAMLSTLPLLALLSKGHAKPAAYSFNRHAIKAIATNGAALAAVAYANYLFFFWRHNLSPAYIEQALPQYHQATTLTTLTLLLCIFVIILFERADKRHKLLADHLSSNRLLLMALGACTFAIALIAYVPFLQSLFATGSLDVIDWLTAILSAVLYGTLRILQRHTRQHTRHAVLRLHQNLKD